MIDRLERITIFPVTGAVEIRQHETPIDEKDFYASIAPYLGGNRPLPIQVVTECGICEMFVAERGSELPINEAATEIYKRCRRKTKTQIRGAAVLFDRLVRTDFYWQRLKNPIF